MIYCSVDSEGFSKAKEEWEKNLLLWGTDLQVPRSPSLSLSLIVTLFISRQTPGEISEASTGTGTGSAGPTRHSTEEMDVGSNGNQPLDGDATGDAEGGKDGNRAKIKVNIHRRNITN